MANGFEKTGTALLTKVVHRSDKSKAIALPQDVANFLKLQFNQMIRIIIFRRKEDAKKEDIV